MLRRCEALLRNTCEIGAGGQSLPLSDNLAARICRQALAERIDIFNINLL
jgi:hypothetical protein